MFKSKNNRKGKLIRLLSIFTILCLLASITTMSAGTPDTRISTSTVAALTGGNASVSLNLEGNPGIWGLKLRITYDHDALTLKSVGEGIVFLPDEFTLSENLNKDPFIIVANGSDLVNKTQDGCIVTLNFKVSRNASESVYPIFVEVVQAIDVDGYDLNLSADNGRISVTDDYIPGDINGSSKVDISDALLLFQHSLMPDLYPLSYPDSVDFNTDGKINIKDALLLFQHSLMPDLYPLT